MIPAAETVDFRPFVERAERPARTYHGLLQAFGETNSPLFRIKRREWFLASQTLSRSISVSTRRMSLTAGWQHPRCLTKVSGWMMWLLPFLSRQAGIAEDVDEARLHRGAMD